MLTAKYISLYIATSTISHPVVYALIKIDKLPVLYSCVQLTVSSCKHTE